MGFAGSVQSMVTQSLTYANGFFGDFWPILALFVGLSALGFIVHLFRS